MPGHRWIVPALMLAITVLGARSANAAPVDTLVYRASADSPARFYALRLSPGQDLRQELLRFAREKHLQAAFIASCAGSCTRTSVRYANQPQASVRDGHFEIVSLSGTLTFGGMHVHASFSDSTGATFGGHLMDGSTIYTTAEIVIGELTRTRFARQTDPTFGYQELKVIRR